MISEIFFSVDWLPIQRPEENATLQIVFSLQWIPFFSTLGKKSIPVQQQGLDKSQSNYR